MCDCPPGRLIGSPGQPPLRPAQAGKDGHDLCAPTAPQPGIVDPRGRSSLSGRNLRSPRRDLRRGGLLDRHERLPGDTDRPQLPPSGRRRHRPPHREHRLERRGRRVRTHLGRGLRRPRSFSRPLQLARPAQPRRRTSDAGHRGHQRHRHPRADPSPAGPWRDARRHLDHRPRRRLAPCEGARVPPDGGRRPCRRRDHPRGLRRAGRGGEAVHRRSPRPGDQDHDAVPDGRAGHGGARAPGVHRLRDHRGAVARRALLLQRAR